MIQFTCMCGRSLKAPDKLAGKKVRCPGCSAVISIPRVAHAPTTRKQAVSSKAIPSPVRDLPYVPVLAVAGTDSRRAKPAVQISPSTQDFESKAEIHAMETVSVFVPCQGRERPIVLVPSRERHWFESWCYPLLGVPFIFRISVALAVLTALGVPLYPAVLQHGVVWWNGVLLAIAWGAAIAVCVGYGCSFLDLVLEHAISGDVKDIYVPDSGPFAGLASLVRWGLCFAAGPAPLVYFACLYWIHCGDPTAVDGFILVELTAPAIAYWLLSLVVLGKHLNLVWPSPQQVLKVACRLGPRALVAGIVATAVGLVHLRLGAAAITSLHLQWPVGLFLLSICWFSAWYCGAFGLRVLGLWYYRSRRTSSASARA